ncbi:uncharacterized protein LOC106160949 [Lingula anatina]|uniref:Uncharacterized protein LOC106160949 n=1 Tax=Lingula anatina TaxID=7574 RepID=A0A1S3I4M6_LINAN|nr:uncharacterized protein LOC106160949 [Lingula anatina]|eukprot:XP_013393217.1 uncharacterized protein LOC106160949 [Lingula anatina]
MVDRERALGRRAREPSGEGDSTVRAQGMPLLECSLIPPRPTAGLPIPNAAAHFLARELGHCSQCGSNSSTAVSSVASDLDSYGSGRDLLPPPLSCSRSRQVYNGTPVYDDIEGNSPVQCKKTSRTRRCFCSLPVTCLLTFLVITGIAAAGTAFYFLIYKPDVERLQQKINKTEDLAKLKQYNGENLKNARQLEGEGPFAFLYGKKPERGDPTPIVWDTERRRKPRNTILKNITEHKIRNDHHLRVHQRGIYRVQSHLCFKVQVDEADDISSTSLTMSDGDERIGRGRSKTFLHFVIRNCQGNEDEVLKTLKLVYLLPGEEYKYCSDLSGLVGMDSGCSLYTKIKCEDDSSDLTQYLEHYNWNFFGLNKV